MVDFPKFGHIYNPTGNSLLSSISVNSVLLAAKDVESITHFSLTILVNIPSLSEYKYMVYVIVGEHSDNFKICLSEMVFNRFFQF